MNLADIQSVIRKKIPDGLVVTAHTFDAHFYKHTPTDLVYPSVTTKSGILDAPYLKQWAVNLAITYIEKNGTSKDTLKKAKYLHKDVLEDAGGVGTIGHGYVDDYLRTWIKNKKQPLDIRKFITSEDVRLYAITRSCEAFCNDFEVIPIVSELNILSKKHRFGGQLDALMYVKINGRYHFCLVDWKTSNSIDKFEYAMQVSAYWQGLFELTGLRPSKLLIVRFDKEQMKYEVMMIEQRPKVFEAFSHLSKVYDIMNDGTDKLSPLIKKERISI